MAHTDKDRPLWLIRHIENYPIRHDHRHGKCVVGTLEDERARHAGSYHSGWRHHHSGKCGKWVEVEFTCTKDDPVRPWKRNYWRPRDVAPETLCWNYWIEHEDPDVCWGGVRRHTGCLGHTRWEERRENYCGHCDNLPEFPTCDPSWYGVDSGYRYSDHHRQGKSTSEWCRLEFHGPERARERSTARDWVKGYNAGDPLDDWDYDNRQGRHTVIWDLW